MTFYITQVRKTEDGSHVAMVLVMSEADLLSDVSREIGMDKTTPKPISEIVSGIKRGDQFFTATYTGGKRTKGQLVKIVTENGNDTLTTDSNSYAPDNLSNLTVF